MRVLAISSEGDPLFVRDENGDDFEVESHWAGDARLSAWAEDPETKWDEIWAKVYRQKPPLSGTRTALRALLGAAAPTRVKDGGTLVVTPVTRFLTASFLPTLDERTVVARRARALARLGADEPVDEVVLRRNETHDRLWRQQHPKALPAHSAIYVSASQRDAMSVEKMTVAWKFPQTASSFMEISPVPLPSGPPSDPVAAIEEAAAAIPTLDETQKRRAEALRRLQDPKPGIDEDIRMLIDGLRSRPVM